MKTFTLCTVALVVTGFTAGAQKFTLIPQVGIQNPLTRVSLNNLPAFTPLQSQAAAMPGIRVDYQLKKGFGPFAGISTSPSAVAFSFNNPESAARNFTATQGNTMWQLQGGLQARSKPMYFKKTASIAQPAVVQEPKPSYSRCGRYQATSRCGTQNRQQAAAPAPRKGMFVSIVPSAGIAFNPFTPQNLNSKLQTAGSTATYQAGNINTAIITGVGFEFGNDTKRLFTLNINHFKGLGNNAETLVTESGLKMITTNLSSSVSGWSASFGIPIAMGKKPAIKQPEKKTYHYSPYRSGAKSSCRRVI